MFKKSFSNIVKKKFFADLEIAVDPEGRYRYPPNSYIVKIPLGDYTKEQIEDRLTLIYGDPIHNGWFFLYVNVREKRENYMVLLRGKPRKKFFRLCLEFPCQIELIIPDV